MTKETIEGCSGDLELREIAKGFIIFSIKADDTEENEGVHKAFWEFCKVETNNDYTQGIKRLLEFYEADFKYELLYNQIGELRTTLNDLQSSVVQLNKEPSSKKPNDTLFGED